MAANIIERTSRRGRLLGVIALACFLHILIPINFCLTTDEAFSWTVAAQGRLDEIVRMAGRDVHPPLYYVCLALWSRAFGDGEAILRALSGVFSVATVVAIYGYTHIWSGEREGRADRAALLAALLVALCVPQVAMAHFARMYTLMSLLAVITAGALLVAVQRPAEWRAWTCYVLGATMMLYSHNYALYFVVGQVVWVAVEAAFVVGQDRRGVLMRRAAVAFSLVGAFYLPWLPWLRWQVSQVSAAYWIPPLSWSTLACLPVQLIALPLNQVPELAWYAILLLAFATVLLLWPWRGAPGERQLLAILGSNLAATVGVNLIMGRSVFVPRYLTYLLPLALVPLAFWLSCIRIRSVRRVVIGWVLFWCTYMLAQQTWEFLPVARPPADIRRVVHTLLQRARPDEPLVVVDRPIYLLMRYYLREARASSTCLLFDPEATYRDKRHVVFASAILPGDDWVPGDPRVIGARRCWVVGAIPCEWKPEGWTRVWDGVFDTRSSLGVDCFTRVACYRPTGQAGDRAIDRGGKGGESR